MSVLLHIYMYVCIYIYMYIYRKIDSCVYIYIHLRRLGGLRERGLVLLRELLHELSITKRDSQRKDLVSPAAATTTTSTTTTASTTITATTTSSHV